VGTAVNLLNPWAVVARSEGKTLLNVDYADADPGGADLGQVEHPHLRFLNAKPFRPPKHGGCLIGWGLITPPGMAVGLDIAEAELSLFTKQCLNRRISDLETLRRQATAWARRRNVEQIGVDRQFTTEDTRTKPK